MNKLIRYLNFHIQGCVYDKPSVLFAYSKDQSILKIKPRLVAVPDTTEDVQFLVRFCNELAAKGYNLPLAVWGSGLDKTGADLTKGMVISTEKLDKIKEIDDRARLVRVEAGCTLAKLNAVLSVYGLTLPIKANGRETIGGIISSFRKDEYSKKYGGIYAFVDRIEAVLSNGDLIQTVPYTKHGLKSIKKKSTYEAKIYRDLDSIITKNFDIIEDFEKEQRDYAGYRMVSEVKRNNNFDLMPLFHGAQGSLGVITEVILRVEALPRDGKRMLARFAKMEDVAEFTKRIEKLNPLSVQLIDSRIARIAANAGKMFDIISKPMPGSYYVVVTFNDNSWKTHRDLKTAQEIAKKAKSVVIENLSNKQDFDNLDDVFDIYLNDEATRPIVTGDTHIPLDHLAEFASKIDMMEKQFNRKMPIFGSLLTGIFEVRPSFDLSSVTDRKQAIIFFREYSNMLGELGGSLTGGGAEGRVKAAVTTPRINERELKFHKKIKTTFDPNNILAPDIKLGATVQELIRNLRTDEIPGFMV